jgi:hypothetical protein
MRVIDRFASSVITAASGLSSPNRLFCFFAVGFVGILSIFGSAEPPETAVKRFADAFNAKDKEALRAMIHPDIAEDKEIGSGEVGKFIERYKDKSLELKDVKVNSRFKSEDGEVERAKATLLFRAPELSPKYPGAPQLEMDLLWVYEEGKWWLERPLAIHYRVAYPASYPTPEQEETALRFQAAIDVLDKLGLPGKEDLALAGATSPGSAKDELREIEKLHRSERGRGGVKPNASGVDVLLKAAGRDQGGFLQIYHGDFRGAGDDQRRPVPWDAFKDYVEAAIKRAKGLEARSKNDQARALYRRIISFGRLILNEPGGLSFLHWGMTFEMMAARELARLPAAKGAPDPKEVEAFAGLCTRRLDLLRTALSCLDDMSDYRSLKAAIMAAERQGDLDFRPWGINTLVILGVKGAPAAPETIEKTREMVLVESPLMRQTALAALDKLAAEPSGRIKSFIEQQQKWVSSHDVYGGAATLGRR